MGTHHHGRSNRTKLNGLYVVTLSRARKLSDLRPVLAVDGTTSDRAFAFDTFAEYLVSISRSSLFHQLYVALSLDSTRKHVVPIAPFSAFTAADTALLCDPDPFFVSPFSDLKTQVLISARHRYESSWMMRYKIEILPGKRTEPLGCVVLRSGRLLVVIYDNSPPEVSHFQKLHMKAANVNVLLQSSYHP